MINRKCCPICGRNNYNNDKIFERDYFDSSFLAPMKNYIVYICKECGFIYSGDIDYRISLDEYYSKYSKYETESYNLGNDKYYKEESDLLLDNIKNKNISVLDVGCAGGTLLHFLNIAGINNVLGLEISKANCEFAKKQYGIDVINDSLGGDICEEKLGDLKFNLIIMTGVLEHIDNIVQAITWCEKHLYEKGYLFIEVPDVSLFSLKNNLYQEFSVEHINFFGLDSLDKLISKFGFGLSAYHRNETYQSIRGLWQKNNLSPLKFDCPNSENDIIKYISLCDDYCSSIKAKFYFYKDLKINVWGAGSVLAMLIQKNVILKDNIYCIVDSNPNYLGLKAYDKVIESPSVLKNNNDYPILIASQGAEKSIINQIKSMGLKNEIILLFS